MKKSVILLFVVCALATTVFAQSGVKKKRPLPHEYGRVVINNFSEQAGLPAVEVEHWLHRSKFTCRLCHVDLAFAMKANGSNIRAADNAKGFYCGTCHNGKQGPEGKKMFSSCAATWTRDDLPRCQRCHSHGKVVKREYDFDTLTAKFPKERFGNGVNWEKAENDGLIKLIDEIPGVSIPRPPMAAVKDFSISPATQGIAEIIFSHKKHTVWNGCELCHPQIFAVRKGLTKNSMVQIFDGQSCGTCHLSVAFPVIDCQRCHTQPVQ